MRALILAGGKGTRLAQYTRDIAKPMIPIGDKPLLHHQVDLLVRYGLTDITILVNYLKDPIIDYFGNGKYFGASIQYFEEREPLGTTGGIKEIEESLTSDFLVLYGDVMVNMDIRRFIRFHESRNSECTLVLHPNDHPYDSDLVDVDENDRITAFHPKPHQQGQWYHNLVNAGLYILSPTILNYLVKGSKSDFGRDIFPGIYKKIAMFGYHTTEYLKDMGTPDRLETVIHDLKSGKIERSSYQHKQPAIFLDRDGVLNTERSYISKPEELEVFDNVPGAVRKINQAGLTSVVVTNQSAIARNLCTEQEVQIIHHKLETILGTKGAWLDAIYYCPHHPDKGFPDENPRYKIVCDCRKPAIGMFKKAIEKFNIDPSLSYMIGDSERDIQAGVNAGCTTIGVRAGYGVKKTRVHPDYVFNDLAEAVDFIVDEPYKSAWAQISDRFAEDEHKSPFVILIGGNTRSGKSTLATYLRLAFKRSGRKVLQVSLDNWILPEARRTPSMNVYERFQIDKIEKDLNRLFAGETLAVSTYVEHIERIPLKIEYNLNKADVIIIEGVVALSSEKIRNMASIKIFTDVDSAVFLRRMNDYYSWRGRTADQTAELIKKRELDEYQLIEKESKFADMIINSSCS